MSSELLLGLRRLWVLFLLLAILHALFSLLQAFFGKKDSVRQWAARQGGMVSLCMTIALAALALLLFPRPERSLTICAILGAFSLLLLAMKCPGHKEQGHKSRHSTGGRWIKLTPAEMSEASRKRQRGRIIGAVIIGFVIFGLPLLTSSSVFAKIREEHPQPPRFDGGPLFPQMGRLPFAILIGFIGAFVFYFFLSRPGRRTMICVKCGAAKYDDGSLQCKCGGHFEEMKNLRWEE